MSETFMFCVEGLVGFVVFPGILEHFAHLSKKRQNSIDLSVLTTI